MPINIPNYIRKRIQELDNTIDVREGSVISDILINPLTSILTPYQLDHEEFLKNQSLTDISKLTEEELDAIASNYLIERKSGSFSSGFINIYFSAPRSVGLPKGTMFTDTSGSLKFETVTEFNITKYQMSQNTSDYPNYDTGKIPVKSVNPGNEYNMKAGTITKSSSLGFTPLYITNVQAFTGGVQHEDNESFLIRLKDEINNISLASAYGIKSKLKSSYSSIVDIEVVGAGHPLMKRDLTNLVEQVSSYEEEDFYLVYSGKHDGLYDKKHAAYSDVFVDIDESADVAFPNPAGWINEFSDAMYEGLYKKNDIEYSRQDQFVLVREYFNFIGGAETANVQEELQMHFATVLNSGQWQLHDGITPSNTLAYLDEIGLGYDSGAETGVLRLGKSLSQDPDSPDYTGDIQVGLAELQNIYSLVGSVMAGTTDAAYEELSSMISNENYNNLAPIFHKPLSQHTGTTTTCRFKTNDKSENGEMSYITSLRNSSPHLPHDGYGIAWRKQPGFLLRMQNNQVLGPGEFLNDPNGATHEDNDNNKGEAQ